MIDDLAFALGPGIVGLIALGLLYPRAKLAFAGVIRTEGNIEVRRIEQPKAFWTYLLSYLIVAVLGILMLLWSLLWVGYLVQYWR